MKSRKVFYSTAIVLSIIAIFCGSKLTAAAGSPDRSVFFDQVSEFFGFQSEPVTVEQAAPIAPASNLVTVPVSLPVVSASPSTVVVVPITTGSITGLGVISYDFNVTFNPAILTPASPPVDNAGTISSGMIVTPNVGDAGHLVVSAFQSTDLAGSGTLLNLRFNVVGTLGGQSTTLVFEDYTDSGSTFHPRFQYNEGDPEALTTNGTFTVAGATPTSTNTATQTPTFTPTHTSTNTPTNTATVTPTNTATNTPSASPVNTPQPTLGVYAATSIALSDNVTIVPSAPPTDTTGISVETAPPFIGELTADPVTGVVRVTNAHHANIIPAAYTVKLKAFGPGGVSQTTFSMTVTNGTPCSGFPGFMSPAVPEIAVGTSPRSIAIGDFNNDGIQDLAVPNYAASNVSIRLGNGTGGFTSPAVPEVAVSAFPRSIAVADFNNDGKQDIATTGFALGDVSIRFGDGTGGFTSPAVPEVSVDKGPYSIAVGDFNNDGNADFATANSASVNVSIRLGNGLGGFSSPSIPSIEVDGSPRSIAIADFNNDGNQDFATANSVSANVSIRLGDGTGGFTSPLHGEVELGFSNNPRSIAIGDLNGDGKQDFVAANFNSSSVSIGLGNGSGGFTSPATPLVTVGDAPQGVAIGDFNNDGKQDLATAGSSAGTVSIRYGTGTGAFTLPTTPEITLGGATPLALAVGDFDGDGFQDFATANDGSNNVSLRVGSCAPFSLSGTVRYGNAISGPTPPRYISNATITATGQATLFTTTGAPGPGEGQYTLNLFGPGPYTITPTKPFSFDTSINSFDAARVIGHVVGTAPLTGNAKVVADVAENGVINSFDAAQIARYVASLPPFGAAGQWRFYTIPNVPFPVGSTPTSRTIPSLTGNITGQDFTGLLMGDVSGNWANTGARPARGPERATAVILPRLSAKTGRELIVPVSVESSNDKGIVSYEFILRYDPSVIQPLGTGVEVTGTASRGLSYVTNAQQPGVLRVVMYGAFPIDGSEVLLNLRFMAVGNTGSVSPLTWEKFMLNDGLRMTTTNGIIELN